MEHEDKGVVVPFVAVSMLMGFSWWRSEGIEIKDEKSPPEMV